MVLKGLETQERHWNKRIYSPRKYGGHWDLGILEYIGDIRIYPHIS